MESHDHHNHDHNMRAVSRQRLWYALIINLLFLIVEVVGGILTNSLALLADAGHMLTDVGALILALFMARIALQPSTPERTFGLLRAEVLGAFLNGAALVLIVGLIFWEAWHRFGKTIHVNGPAMLGIASVGLFANIISAIILSKNRRDNVNIEGAFLHMISDALGSVGAIIAGLVIWFFEWQPIDLLASVIIGILILWSSWGFLKKTVNILLEATPDNINYMEVKKALEDMDHIEKVHDLHIWTITSGVPVLSAHIALCSDCSESNHWPECLNNAREMLRSRFKIEHTTLQVEPSNSCSLECQFKDPSNH